ncbi:T9SS type A sorting domain-containing protein, partial [candidate division WOR-3 bacterium]|nr:T9SS type A sorting domain-containing protein [candidate division WOR-3 bacterium]
GNIYFEGIGQEKYTYSIFDLSGREITKGTLVKGKISQLKLVQGFYFLKLNNNQSNNYFKFVVLR